MKMLRFYLVSICLVAATLMLLVKAVKNKKEATMLASQLTLKQGNQDQSKPGQASDSETIAVKQLIEGLAKNHNVQIPIRVEKDSRIKIGEPEKTEEGSEGGKTTAATTTTVDSKQKNLAVLNNYEGMIGFLNAIAGIPYVLEYENGCIGPDCTYGLELTIIVKKAPSAG